jgi:hypothetical protein
MCSPGGFTKEICSPSLYILYQMNSKRRHLTLSIVRCCQPPCCSYRTNLLPTSLFGRHQEHPPQRYRRRSRFHCSRSVFVVRQVADNVLLVAAEVHCIFQPFSLRAGPDMCNHTRMPHRRTPTSDRNLIAELRRRKSPGALTGTPDGFPCSHPPMPSTTCVLHHCFQTGRLIRRMRLHRCPQLQPALRGSLQSPDPTLPLHSATILRSRLFSHQMCKSS